MKQIVILALHLSVGGIEQAICDLANNLDKDKYQVKIISTYKINENPAFKLKSNIKVEYLIDDLKPNRQDLLHALKTFNIIKGVKESITAIKVLMLKKKLNVKAIKNLDCDIVVTTRTYHNKLVSKYLNDDRVLKIAWEHNYLINDHNYVNQLVKSLKNFNYLVLPTQELTNYYQKLTLVKCVHIPLMISFLPQQSKLTSNHIISVGRLSKEKGYLDLIEVFKLFHKKHPTWILDLVGDGDQLEVINDKIKEYKLEQNVIIHGFLNKKELYNCYYKSAIFVLTSYRESFGLAVLEALAVGLPVVMFDTAKGPQEMVKDNYNGYIIKDRNFNNMAEKLNCLASNLKLRRNLGNHQEVVDSYLPTTIIKEWEKILK